MVRREWLGMMGAGAAGLMALGGRAARADQDEEAHEACLKACVKCAEKCNECYQHCLKMLEEGHRDHARSARLTLDCADFCTQAACLMSRGSEMMGLACQACAEACKRCGDECAKFHDEEMKECAEACRKCEQACREMARSDHHHEHQHH